MRHLAATVALTLCVAAGAADPPTGGLADRQLVKLLEVRTLYVDSMGGKEAGSFRDLVIGSVQRTGLFILTEDEAHADAFFRGSAEDLIFQDYERYRTGLNVRGAASGSKRESGESEYFSASVGIGDTEDASSRQRKHEALAAVRIVLKNGEVVWSTTRESMGARYQGSASHVAEQVARDLEQAYLRANELAKE